LILALARFEIAAKDETRALEKAWATYRKQHRLNIEGKVSAGDPQGCPHWRLRGGFAYAEAMIRLSSDCSLSDDSGGVVDLPSNYPEMPVVETEPRGALSVPEANLRGLTSSKLVLSPVSGLPTTQKYLLALPDVTVKIN
jgi:hypothetical protein